MHPNFGTFRFSFFFIVFAPINMTRVKPVTPAQVLKAAVYTVPELEYLANIPDFSVMTKVVNPCLTNLAPVMGNVRARGSELAKAVKGKVLNSIRAMPPIGSMLQSAWIATHFLTLLGGLGYIWFRMKLDSAYDYSALQCYNLMAISITSVYLLVTYRHIFLLLSTNKQSKIEEIPFSIIMKSENTQLLIMSLLVLVSPCNVWKILSSCIYSFLNLSTYIMLDVFPETSLTEAVLPLLTYLEDSLLVSGAIIDFFAVFVYLYEFLTTNTSYYVIIYFMILCTRLENSESCRQAMKWMFSTSYYLMERNPWLIRFVAILKAIEVFLIPKEEQPPQSAMAIDTAETPQTGISVMKKRDRIASIRFDSFYVVNDLNMI